MSARDAQHSEKDKPERPGLLHRLLTGANVAALAVGIIVMYVGLLINDAHLWVVIWTVLAAVAGAGVWYLIDQGTDEPGLTSILSGIPFLGAIPAEDPRPAPALDDGPLSDRFMGLLRRSKDRQQDASSSSAPPDPGKGPPALL